MQHTNYYSTSTSIFGSWRKVNGSNSSPPNGCAAPTSDSGQCLTSDSSDTPCHPPAHELWCCTVHVSISDSSACLFLAHSQYLESDLGSLFVEPGSLYLSVPPLAPFLVQLQLLCVAVPPLTGPFLAQLQVLKCDLVLHSSCLVMETQELCNAKGTLKDTFIR